MITLGRLVTAAVLALETKYVAAGRVVNLYLFVDYLRRTVGGAK